MLLTIMNNAGNKTLFKSVVLQIQHFGCVVVEKQFWIAFTILEKASVQSRIISVETLQVFSVFLELINRLEA